MKPHTHPAGHHNCTDDSYFWAMRKLRPNPWFSLRYCGSEELSDLSHMSLATCQVQLILEIQDYGALFLD
jgi:hypothetical protein